MGSACRSEEGAVSEMVMPMYGGMVPAANPAGGIVAGGEKNLGLSVGGA